MGEGSGAAGPGEAAVEVSAAGGACAIAALFSTVAHAAVNATLDQNTTPNS
jgi:hypothetical protein